jgi:hypothetical protein
VTSEKRIAFRRRSSSAGGYESSCPACFEVISKRANKAELEADEAAHHCDELTLKEALDSFRDAPFSKVQEPLWRRWLRLNVLTEPIL